MKAELTGCNHVVRCFRCGREGRENDEWDVDQVAGCAIGLVCPNCRTPRDQWEDATLAPLKDATSAPEWMRRATVALLQVYPTPQILRREAHRLATARSDPVARQVAGFMQAIARAAA